MKKRFFVFLLALALLIQPVLAVDSSRSYSFGLSVNDSDTVEVSKGDIITLTLRLYRTDADESYTMYGMQSELRYDGSFLEVVEGTGTTFEGVQTTDIATADRYREYYMNFISMVGGATWPAETVVGTVQFRVIGDVGVSYITNEDFMVTLANGNDSYQCSSNQIMLILSTECMVKFMSNGGTPVPNQTVYFGETVAKPADPTREGYIFQGWYSDIHLSNPWDFDQDTVEGNMTLYAKWAADPNATEPTQPVRPEQPSESFPWWVLVVILAVSAVVVAMLLWYKKKQR